MKKLISLIALPLLFVHCASKPLALEEKDFSSEAAFKVIAEVNRVIPHFQSGNVTVEELSKILQTPLEYDLPSGLWVAQLDGYSLTGRFDGELKDEKTALTQVNFNLAPKEFLTYADVQSAFGTEYVTTRQSRSVVIRQNLAHAGGVELLVHLSEPAHETNQPVRSLLIRRK